MAKRGILHPLPQGRVDRPPVVVRLADDVAYWTCPTPLPKGLRPYGNTYIPAVLTDASGYATDHAALCCVEGNGSMGFQAGAALGGATNRGSGCFVAYIS